MSEMNLIISFHKVSKLSHGGGIGAGISSSILSKGGGSGTGFHNESAKLEGESRKAHVP